MKILLYSALIALLTFSEATARHYDPAFTSRVDSTGTPLDTTDAEIRTRHPNGIVHVCRLNIDRPYGQTQIPAGSFCFLTEQGLVRYCFLPKDGMLVEGRLCRGGGHDWQTCFHPNGRLHIAWLKQDETIEGVPCASASFWKDVFGGGASTRFHDNGRLARAKLASDYSTQSRSFEKGDIVYFDRDGKLIEHLEKGRK